MTDVVSMKTGTDSIGVTAGVRRLPLDEPQQAVKQSWVGYYVDPTQQPIHYVLRDAFYSVGGFAGDIDVSSENPSKRGDATRYSYVDPMSSELQYRNRVKQTKYFNYFARLVNSVVNPVFSRSIIETNSYLGSSNEKSEDKLLTRWVSDCTGTNTSYRQIQKNAMQKLTTHDAVYYTMTKKEGAELPSLSVYSAVDVIDSHCDEYGLLDNIMFNRGHKIIDGEQVETAIQFFMNGGYCYIQWWLRGNSRTDWAIYGDEKSTGVAEMVATAHISQAVSVGEIVPKYPSMKSLLDPCLAIFQDESKLSWLYSLHNLPTPYWWGSIEGAFIGAGQGFQNETSDPNNGYAPAPNYMSVNSSLLPASVDKLKFNLERLKDIAKESGIETNTGQQAQSGYSKEFEFQATEERLRGTVDKCKEMDKWVFRMLDIYLVRSNYRYERQYPKTFYPEQQPTLEDYSEWVDKANDAGLVRTRNILIERAVKTLLGRSISDLDSEVITSEISKSSIESSVLE